MGDMLYLPHKVVMSIRDNIKAVRNDEVVVTTDRTESRKIREYYLKVSPYIRYLVEMVNFSVKIYIIQPTQEEVEKHSRPKAI